MRADSTRSDEVEAPTAPTTEGSSGGAMNDGEPAVNHRSLADEQRSLARARIIGAAQAVLASKGLTATVDDVAEAAGMSRRTVFRHFATRENVLANAVRAALAAYRDRLPLGDGDDDHLGDDPELTTWLGDLLEAVHNMNATTGRAYWELTLGDHVTGELATAAAERREADQRFSQAVVARLWSARDGEGEPPRWLADTVSVHLSGYSTQALAGVFGRSPDEVAEVARRSIEAALAAALAGNQQHH